MSTFLSSVILSGELLPSQKVGIVLIVIALVGLIFVAGCRNNKNSR